MVKLINVIDNDYKKVKEYVKAREKFRRDNYNWGTFPENDEYIDLLEWILEYKFKEIDEYIEDMKLK